MVDPTTIVEQAEEEQEEVAILEQEEEQEVVAHVAITDAEAEEQEVEGEISMKTPPMLSPVDWSHESDMD